MDDQEYKDAFSIGAAMMFSFLLFPIFCTITTMCGYIRYWLIIVEGIIAAIAISCFVLRTKFLIKYPKYITKKRFLFETIAYIACIVFAIGMAFAVVENEAGIIYELWQVLIFSVYIIFVFVVMGYHIATAKKVAKSCIAERQRRLSGSTDSPKDSE